MLVGVLCLGLGGCHKEGEAEAGKEEAAGEESHAHVTVRVEPARKGTVVETVEGLGRSEAIPAKLAMLTPAVEGHVHELVVKQGEPVKKGQTIVELDKAVALADLAEKTAARDGLKASLRCSSRFHGPRSGGPTSWRSSRRRWPSSVPGGCRRGYGRCWPGMRSPSSRSSRPTWR